MCACYRVYIAELKKIVRAKSKRMEMSVLKDAKKVKNSHFLLPSSFDCECERNSGFKCLMQ